MDLISVARRATDRFQRGVIQNSDLSLRFTAVIRGNRIGADDQIGEIFHDCVDLAGEFQFSGLYPEFQKSDRMCSGSASSARTKRRLDPLAAQNSRSFSVKRQAESSIISVLMTETHSPVTGFQT